MTINSTVTNDERWATTRSGSRVFYQNPTPDSIMISDIAWHLSNQCRYAGGTRRFYSVAEHCVLVAWQVAHMVPQFTIQALMHDAEEAYMPDIPRTIKRVPEMAWYCRTADYLRRAIWDKYGLGEGIPDVVKMVDSQILYLEADQLGMELNPACQPTQDHDLEWAVKIKMHNFGSWSPTQAYHNFLNVIYGRKL